MNIQQKYEIISNFDGLDIIMSRKDNKLDSHFKLLEFSLQTSSARKIVELSHLSFIYQSEQLKVFLNILFVLQYKHLWKWNMHICILLIIAIITVHQ